MPPNTQQQQVQVTKSLGNEIMEDQGMLGSFRPECIISFVTYSKVICTTLWLCHRHKHILVSSAYYICTTLLLVRILFALFLIIIIIIPSSSGSQFESLPHEKQSKNNHKTWTCFKYVLNLVHRRFWCLYMMYFSTKSTI